MICDKCGKMSTFCRCKKETLTGFEWNTDYVYEMPKSPPKCPPKNPPKCPVCFGAGRVFNVAHRYYTAPDGYYPCPSCGAAVKNEGFGKPKAIGSVRYKKNCELTAGG